MTLEQLLDCTADQLEAMSLEDLETYCKPFWPVTRPEMVKDPVVKKKSAPTQAEMDLVAQKRRAVELAKAHGINLKL